MRGQSREVARLANRLRARGREGLSRGMVAPGPAPSAAAVPGTPGPAGVPPKPKGPTYHPLAVLKNLEASKVLTGKQLNQAARALTALEVRPQLRGYKQLANQLTRERNEETAGLGKLGTALQGNVGDVYKNIGAANAQGLAGQQAIAGMLNQQGAQISAQGADQLQKMQAGAVGDYTQGLAARNSPVGGSAQQALSEAVAGQQAAQTANTGAAQRFAANQGAGNVALQAQLAGAAQMQGGAAVGGIGRDIVGRVGASNQKYGENIQSALGKLAEVKATKGAAFNKNLLSLREGEQKFLLGEQATRTNKEKLAAEKEQNAAANAINQQKANASSTSATASLINAQTSRWESQHPGASNNERAKHRQEVKHEIREVHSLIPGVIAEFGAPPKGPKQLNLFMAKMNSKASADPIVVQRVLRNWERERRLPHKPLGHMHR